MPTTFQQIQIILLFVVPGFFVDQIIRRSVLRAPRNSTDSVITYVAWSAVCLLINTPIFVALAPKAAHSAIIQVLSLTLTLFVVPFAVGVFVSSILVRAAEQEWLQELAQLWRVFRIHPAPKAWDWVFYRSEPCYVRVILDDGSWIGGLLGPNSFASSHPASEDLFIEEQWLLGDRGEFLQKIEGTKGVLVKGEKIRVIEFLGPREE